MKKIFLVLMLALFAVPFVFAETCDYSKDVFNKVEGVNLKDSGVVKSLFGANAAVQLDILDTNETFYFLVQDYIVGFAGSDGYEDADFLVTTDSCTLDRIHKGGDVLQEYDDGNIKVKGETAGKKTKLFFGKIGFWFYKVFN